MWLGRSKRSSSFRRFEAKRVPETNSTALKALNPNPPGSLTSKPDNLKLDNENLKPMERQLFNYLTAPQKYKPPKILNLEPPNPEPSSPAKPTNLEPQTPHPKLVEDVLERQADLESKRKAPGHPEGERLGLRE